MARDAVINQHKLRSPTPWKVGAPEVINVAQQPRLICGRQPTDAQNTLVGPGSAFIARTPWPSKYKRIDGASKLGRTNASKDEPAEAGKTRQAGSCKYRLRMLQMRSSQRWSAFKRLLRSRVAISSARTVVVPVSA